MALSCQSWPTNSWCVSAWGINMPLTMATCWLTGQGNNHSFEVGVSTAQTKDFRHDVSFTVSVDAMTRKKIFHWFLIPKQLALLKHRITDDVLAYTRTTLMKRYHSDRVNRGPVTAHKYHIHVYIYHHHLHNRIFTRASYMWVGWEVEARGGIRDHRVKGRRRDERGRGEAWRGRDERRRGLGC